VLLYIIVLLWKADLDHLPKDSTITY